MAKIPENYNVGTKEDMTIDRLIDLLEDMYTDLATAINKKPEIYQRNTDGLVGDVILSNGDININTSTRKVQMLTTHDSASTVIWTTLS